MNPNRTPRKLRRRYFSLIEIMIVVVIIGLLSGIVGVNIYKYIDSARSNKAKAEIFSLKNAIGTFYADMGDFPRSLDELVRNPGSTKWDGPYLDPPKVPKDPWGQDYTYVVPGQHGPFDLYSYGKNKTAGGTGADADINSWGEEE
ncbi:MAG: type II secretion system major pseudopilin GspG [Lentisphaeria bacterium]|jgi:general secretion pathway protein G|nr:type II secretion system major pseudopilin GspG [Lentisphaeria bacterium]